MKAPIALALDAPNIEIAAEWARAVEPYISTAKVGLELFVRYGPTVVDLIRDAAPDLEIFLDLKLHDIPNTVASAAHSLISHPPHILTVHASGGSAMVKAAAEALPTTAIAAVTVLTSLSEREILELGLGSESAIRWAQLAVAGGARAIVCSPHEVKSMRAHLDSSVRLITPGVRPAGSEANDQSRIATPEQALRDGADLLVIGRPITAHYAQGIEAVARAAEAIATSIR